jgi:hypothetical protein
MSAWKDLERRKCRDLGGRRRGQVVGTGWARGSDDDGSLPVSLQCKYTTRYQLRRSWVEQARVDAKADGRPWVLAIDEHNDRYGGIGVVPWPFLKELINWYYGEGRGPLAVSGGFVAPAIPARPSTSRITSRM